MCLNHVGWRNLCILIRGSRSRSHRRGGLEHIPHDDWVFTVFLCVHENVSARLWPIRRWCRWRGSWAVGWLTNLTSCSSKTATTTCACPSMTCPRPTGGASCSPATRWVSRWPRGAEGGRGSDQGGGWWGLSIPARARTGIAWFFQGYLLNGISFFFLPVCTGMKNNKSPSEPSCNR